MTCLSTTQDICGFTTECSPIGILFEDKWYIYQGDNIEERIWKGDTGCCDIYVINIDSTYIPCDVKQDVQDTDFLQADMCCVRIKQKPCCWWEENFDESEVEFLPYCSTSTSCTTN